MYKVRVDATRGCDNPKQDMSSPISLRWWHNCLSDQMTRKGFIGNGSSMTSLTFALKAHHLDRGRSIIEMRKRTGREKMIGTRAQKPQER